MHFAIVASSFPFQSIIRSTHLPPIFYRFFVARVVHEKNPIENSGSKCVDLILIRLLPFGHVYQKVVCNFKN